MPALRIDRRAMAMAFVHSPDGISIELLQEGNLPPQEPWQAWKTPVAGKALLAG
jgi:hypothetical protein